MTHTGFRGCRDSRPQKTLLLPEKQLLAEPAPEDAIQPTKSEQVASVGTQRGVKAGMPWPRLPGDVLSAASQWGMGGTMCQDL